MYQGYGSKAELDRRKQISEALMASGAGAAPQNVGEGLSAISKALFGMLASRANRREEGERTTADRSAYDAYIGGMGQPAPVASPPNVYPVETQPIDPLIQAVIKQESGGRADAVSPKGATGLMQIMPATARDPGFGVRNVFDTAMSMGIPVHDRSDATLDALLRNPEVNKAMGTAYLGAMSERFGDRDKALAAYNAGPGAVEQYGGVPPFEETQNYVKSISAQLGGQPQQMAQPQGPGGIDPRLMDLAGREYLTPQQQMVVQSLLQKQIGGGSDAMTEYQRETLALQRQRLEQEGRNAGRGEYGLAPVWGVGPDGKPALMQLGRDGNPVVPDLPEGFEIARDPIRIDAGTQTILLDPQTRQPIGAIPKDVAGAAAQSAAGSAEGARIGSAPKAVTQADIMLGDIDAVMNDPQLGNALGWNSYIPMDVPGYNTAPRARIEKLQGQAFLQAFESLKGGGAITEIEGKKAEQAIAMLGTSQTEAEFKGALTELRNIITAARERASQRLPAGLPESPDAGLPSSRILRYNPVTGELE